jgi:hypothetical protein
VRETPISAFADAICLSAAAISGRRCSRLDGTPTGAVGHAAAASGMEKLLGLSRN